MTFKILSVAIMATFAVACSHKTTESGHEDEHNHGKEVKEHPEVKFQYTSYSNEFELFAEADAFVIGETANVLSHFSTLPNFQAVETGKITLLLTVNGKETKQTLDKPTRKGIYSFDIQPEIAGTGSLQFNIETEKGKFELIVPNISVFNSDEEAEIVANSITVPKTNTTVFTKEQSWKIDFATDYPKTEPFGPIIKTTALVQSSQGSEVMVSAKTSGMVKLTANNLTEGMAVKTGQVLLTISGNDMADNSLSVKYTEAKNNYERTKTDYERAKELASDKIVSEKELLLAKNQFENAQATFENLQKNFNASGQNVTSPINGYLKQVFVKNGVFVEAGQAILMVSQDKTLVLKAELPPKYASVLGSVQTANLHTMHNHKTYTLDQLNGKVLSYGKAVNRDNYLIPFSLQIDNAGDFVAGGFVELYLKTITNSLALTVPNSALIEEQGSFFVWVQVTPELFEKREITIDQTDGISTEITKGILVTERIVTTGSMLIKLAQATGTLDAHSGHVH